VRAFPFTDSHILLTRSPTDLLHEVSLRSSTNFMDAHNLAIVLCPNLVSSASPARDIAMCAIPNGPTMHASIPSAPQPEGRTTLGSLVKLCIQRYYEVFDEVEDVSEARAPPPAHDQPGDTPSSASPTSSPRFPAFRRQSVLSRGSSNRDSRIDDDELLDDEMLVMPIGPAGGAPPSSWASASAGGAHTVSSSTFRPRHRTGLSGGGSRSLHNGGGAGGAGSAYGTARARSVVSIEPHAVMGRGSIAIGRGTTRKSAGAGVQAIGVTASGFFSSPPGAEGDGAPSA
jgi:Rho GTPase-activating protein 1